MENTQLVHTRYIAGSSGLDNFLKTLGFEIESTMGTGLNKSVVYKLPDTNKSVVSTYEGLSLIEKVDGKDTIDYKGYSVHDELLKFFSKRNPHA